MSPRAVRFGSLALLLAACRPAAPAAPAAPVGPVATAPAPLPPPPVSAAPGPAPPPAPEPAPPAAALAPPAPWGLSYRRACNHSITAPVISVDGKTVASCGALFAADTGRFLRAAPFSVLAFVPGDRALVDDHESGGITLVGPGPEEKKSDPGGRPVLTAVAPDRSRVVSVEKAGSGERTLVVRKLPSLERVRVTALGPGLDGLAVGFLADGREAVALDHPCVLEKCPASKGSTCTRPRCGDRALLVVEGGALVPLVPAIAAIALGERGDLAAVVRKDGSTALLSLPDGRTLAPLPPPPAGVEVEALAVSPTGDRVAFAIPGKLTILGRRGDAFIELLSAPRRFTRALQFAADGRTLFTGDDLAAYREGVTSAPPVALPYPVTLPKGFVALERLGGEWRVHGKEDRSWAAPDEDQAMYFHEKLGVTVKVTRLDPEELGPEGDATAWGLRAFTRAFPDRPLGTAKERAASHFRAWGNAEEGRSAELRWHVSGCDDADELVRVAEHEGGILVVHIEAPGNLKPARIAPWVEAFFDAPLGQAPAAGHAAAPAPRRHGKRRHRKP